MALLLNRLNRLFGELYKRYAVLVPEIRMFEPILLIEEVQTGGSIRLKLDEGWRLRVSTEDGEVLVTAPRKLGLTLLLAFLLLSGAEKGMDIRNKYYDGELKRMDMVLKQHQIDQIRLNCDMHPIEKRSQRIVESLSENPAFAEVSINGVPVKAPPEQSSNETKVTH